MTLDERLEQIKYRLAAGLREMDASPDAFLFCDDLEWTWDLPKILGIPVFHTTSIGDYLAGCVTNEAPFIPIWAEEDSKNGSERKNFLEGWDDASIKRAP